VIKWILGYILGLAVCAAISVYGVHAGWWIWESEYLDIYDVGVLLMAGWTFVYMSVTMRQEIRREKAFERKE